MAKLPDETALGPLPSANSGRPIATYDVSGYARGVAAIGGGVADIGKGVSGAVKDVVAVQASNKSETDQLEQAKAESNYLIQTKQIRDRLSDETDHNGLKEKYETQFQKARDGSAALITNPRQRELWTLKRDPDVEGNVIATTDKAFALQKDGEIASATDRLEQIRQSALATKDPQARGEFIAAGNELISGLQSAKYMTAVQAQALRKNWTENYAVGAVSVLPPVEQVNMLRESPQNKDAVLDRIGGIENATGNPAAKNPNSTATGDFQFIEGTWLDTLKSHRPDLAKGHSDAELLALRSDSKLSREMAGYLADDNSSALRDQGITPSPSSLYLAHFLGAGTAAKVLKAPAGTPVADIVSADAIAANRSVLSGKTTDSVIAWSDQKMGGSPRGKGGLIDFIPEDKRVALLQRAQATVLNDNRRADSDAALEQYQVKSTMGSDLVSMRQTGQGIESLTPDVVKRNFGSKIAQEWQDNREDAHAAWIATHDLSSLDDGQIEQRLASVAPKAGEQMFERRQAIYAETLKAADAVRKRRVDDPAGSVGDDPAVKQALAGLDTNKQETMKALQTARMAAQSRAGIDEDAQSPMTKQEALTLTAPLRRVLPGGEREALTDLGKQIKETYGDNADKAFQYAIRTTKTDAEVTKQAARIMKKLALGEVPSTEDARGADQESEVNAANKAVGGQSSFRQTLDAIQAAEEKQAAAAFAPGEKATGANVPAKAIRDLRANPALAADFDGKYGAGTSKKILAEYPVK